MRGFFIAACIALFVPWSVLADDGRELFGVVKDTASELSSVTGIWQARDQVINGFRISIRLKIEKNKIQSAVRCMFQGATGYASVTAPMTVTENTFEVLTSAKSQTTFGNGYTCTANADKTMATNYQVRLGYLYINNQLAFEKLRDL